MGNNPIKPSLYTDVLYKMLDEARKRGEDDVKFEDVDKRVVELSHAITNYNIDKDYLKKLDKLREDIKYEKHNQ